MEYIFYIESHIFLFYNKKKVLVYNSIDFNWFKIRSNTTLFNLIESLEKSKTGTRCIIINDKELEDNYVADFIHEIGKRFWGDLLEKMYYNTPPLIIAPQCNFTNIITENLNIVNFVNDVRIAINTEDQGYLYGNIYKQTQYLINGDKNLSMDKSTLQYIIGKIGNCNHITFLGKNIINNLLNMDIESLNIDISKITINIDFSEIVYNSSFSSANFNIIVILSNIHFPNFKLEKTYQKATYIFIVTSNIEYKYACTYIDKYQLNAKIIPIYNGENIEFIKEVLFYDEKSIKESRNSKENIFIHKYFNSFDFGKITIFPNGLVFANPNFPSIGNILKENFKSIIFNEINKGKSWLRIRDSGKCKHCIYKFLCPSPSSYELILKKDGLCTFIEYVQE